MKTCNDTGNCRAQYSCVLPGQITASGGFVEEGGQTVARIIDLDSYKAVAKICAALAPGTEVPSSLQYESDAGL